MTRVDAPPARGSGARCIHCGLSVPVALIREADEQFCCAGCETAFHVLQAAGLGQFYALAERREEPVQSTGRSYAEFDHPRFHALYVTDVPAGRSRVDLYLEGVHCASCVWLVERVPLIVPGVLAAELDVRRSLARVTWDPRATRLSSIARALDSLGYAPHPFRGARRDELRRREDRAMLARIGVAGAIAVNVMLAALALYSGALAGMEREFERYFRWVSFALVTPAMLWPARLFFAGAWSALRARTLHMDVPIAVGLAAGYLRGAMNTIQDSGPIYFDGLATLTFALLVGRYLQQRGQRAAADGAELLYSLTPHTARLVHDTGVEDVPAEAVLPGMLVEVRAGETFPADGVVEDGRSEVDAALLTGESRPVRVDPGDEAFAGTLNLSSPVRVRVRQSGEDSRVARILRQVEESSARRAPVEVQANRLAARFVAVVLLLAAATFVGWHFIDPSRAADNAIALLVVTCPCALALSTPLALSMAIGRAARGGIFVKGGDVLERLSRPGVMLLDKTGTITEGHTALLHWSGPDEVRPLVLALERESSHPIAAGFRAAWPSIATPAVESSRHVVGGGIVGRVNGHDVLVGSPRFVGPLASGATPPDESGVVATRVLVAVDGVVVARAAFGDPVRRDSAEAVRDLQTRHWRVEMLSGDEPAVVHDVAAAIGIAPSACVAGAPPEEKLRVVDERLAANPDAPVVMVGDGINDAAAIAAASVGVGVHGGAEACLATADVYLAKPGLRPLTQLLDGAQRTMRVIRRNFAFSLAYNLVGAALAIGGVLDPLVASILMPASSLTVVLTSWRGRTFGGS